MIISHKHKFISLDPPKTGTNYRQNLLQDYGQHIPDLQHANLTEVKNALNEFDLSDYYTFTFVRNPWKRYLSWYNHVHRNSPKDNVSQKDFHQFMLWGLSQPPQPSGLRITLAQSFWFKEQGKINVDFIGCLENITEDMKHILNEINIDIKVNEKAVNRSTYKLNYEDAYNQELIDLVANKEKSVIELKGYEYKLRKKEH
jgi:hypothetical protein